MTRPLPNAADLAVKTLWGLTLDQWNRASDTQRTYWREHVAEREGRG